MKLFLLSIWTFISLFLLNTVHSLNYQSAQKSVNQFNYIPVTRDSQITDLVYSSDRDYHFVATVNFDKKSQPDCQVCSAYTDLLKALSTTFKKIKKPNQKLVFSEITYGQATQSTVARFQLKRAPVMVLFKKGSNTPHVLDPSTEAPPQFIQRHTGIFLPIEQLQQQQQHHQRRGGSSPEPGISSIFTLTILISLLLVAYTLYLKWWTIARLGMVVSFISYIFVVGGTVFCYIRSTPMYHYQGGEILYFYPSFQNQFMLEGWMAGGMMVCGALCMVLIDQVVPYIKFRVVRKIVSLVLVVAFFLSVACVVLFFSLKANFYLSGTNLQPYIERLRDFAK